MKKDSIGFLEWARKNRWLNYADGKYYRYEGAGKGWYRRNEKSSEQLYSMYSKK